MYIHLQYTLYVQYIVYVHSCTTHCLCTIYYLIHCLCTLYCLICTFMCIYKKKVCTPISEDKKFKQFDQNLHSPLSEIYQYICVPWYCLIRLPPKAYRINFHAACWRISNWMDFDLFKLHINQLSMLKSHKNLSVIVEISMHRDSSGLRGRHIIHMLLEIIVSCAVD